MKTHSITIEFTFQINTDREHEQIQNALVSEPPISPFWKALAGAVESILDARDTAKVVNAIFVQILETDLPEGSVGALYENLIGPVDEPKLRKEFGDIAVQSECGRDCEGAIEAGKELLEHASAGVREGRNVANILRFCLRCILSAHIHKVSFSPSSSQH